MRKQYIAPLELNLDIDSFSINIPLIYRSYRSFSGFFSKKLNCYQLFKDVYKPKGNALG